MQLFALPQPGGTGFAILHEPGCGKTLTALAIIGRTYLDRKQPLRVLIAAPLSVLPVWQREIDTYLDVMCAVAILSGSGAQRKRNLEGLPASGLSIALVSYETAWRMEDDLTGWQPDMVILDESQRIKSHDAKQSRFMHRLGENAAYRMILTGTPIGNSPLDLWSQYRFLQPDIFGRSFYAFRGRYATMGGYEGKQVVSYKNMDDLTKKAHSIAHRMRLVDAIDMPPYVDKTLYCDLEPAAAKAYRQLKRDAVAKLNDDETITAPRIITQMLRLSQLAGGFLRPDDSAGIRQVSTAKLNLLRETLTDLLADDARKVVIFARFIPEIKAICTMLSKLLNSWESYGVIYGEIPGEARGKAVQDFQINPAVRVFVAQTHTAGLGITLHAADTAIFYSLDYSYMDYQQARARIHRAGQKKPCTAIHLIAQDTIDEMVAAAIAVKQNIADTILDKWKEVFK